MASVSRRSRLKPISLIEKNAPPRFAVLACRERVIRFETCEAMRRLTQFGRQGRVFLGACRSLSGCRLAQEDLLGRKGLHVIF